MNQNASIVLVIEDDPSLAELIGCFLAQAKFRPVLASNGADGLHQAQIILPSLILCDSCLPGLDGSEVIERLRSDSATAHIPVVLMSGYDAARFDGSGASALLQKPFRMNEMVATVQRWARQAATARVGDPDADVVEHLA